MKFVINTHHSLKASSDDCYVIGVFDNGECYPSSQKLSKESQSYLNNLLKKGDFQGKIGETHLFQKIPGLVAERLLVVGCGQNENKSLNESDYRKIITQSIKALITSKTNRILSFLAELPVANRDFAWKIKYAVETCSDALYRFDEYKSKKEPKPYFKEIVFIIPDKQNIKACQQALTEGVSIAQGIELTKNLANQPSNICTPSYLAEQSKKLAKMYSKLSVKVLEEKDMKKLGMGAFLAVAQGSDKDAKLICLEYKGSSKHSAPTVLIGKGVTFDTGGISLKPADGMIGMKYDMCGAATVLGVLKATAELKLPLHLVGILATAENMPSGGAAKPEDIVTTLSGQTVEILNTDAEGRLLLCDALTYSERYKPDVVIDIATLTGAVVVALGLHASGLLSNDETLAKELLSAGIESFDRAWQLPLWEEYQDQLKSPFADMSNVGGRTAGTITAACFLSRFAKKFKWAHLDVAGTAAMMMAGTDRYATGRPIPLLMQYLMNRCE